MNSAIVFKALFALAAVAGIGAVDFMKTAQPPVVWATAIPGRVVDGIGELTGRAPAPRTAALAATAEVSASGTAAETGAEPQAAEVAASPATQIDCAVENGPKRCRVTQAD